MTIKVRVVEFEPSKYKVQRSTWLGWCTFVKYTESAFGYDTKDVVFEDVASAEKCMQQKFQKLNFKQVVIKELP